MNNNYRWSVSMRLCATSPVSRRSRRRYREARFGQQLSVTSGRYRRIVQTMPRSPHIFAKSKENFGRVDWWDQYALPGSRWSQQTIEQEVHRLSLLYPDVSVTVTRHWVSDEKR